MDLHKELTALTLDIIGVSAFGYDFNAMSGEEGELKAAYDKLMPGMSWFRVLRSLYPILFKLPVKQVGLLCSVARAASSVGAFPWLSPFSRVLAVILACIPPMLLSRKCVVGTERAGCR